MLALAMVEEQFPTSKARLDISLREWSGWWDAVMHAFGGCMVTRCAICAAFTCLPDTTPVSTGPAEADPFRAP